jgi:putative toxin-antitoxin system antitoxin component (TIGR02293 family)
MAGKARALVAGVRKARGLVSHKVIGTMETGAQEIVHSIGDSFIEVYRAEPLTRIAIVKDGLPADYLDKLARRLNMTKDRLLPTLGIAPATVSRKVREARPLSTDDSARALGMARLIGQVEAMVQESGDPTGFDAAKWLARWLQEPLAALNGRPPSTLMDTAEGQAMVSNLLARMQSGAYA